METVVLTPEGTLLGGACLQVHATLPFLGKQLVLKSGCTLRSFLRMFVRYPILQELSEFLPDWVTEATQSPEQGCSCPEVAQLVLGKTNEFLGFPPPPRVEQFLWLRGIPPENIAQWQAQGGEERMATALANVEVRFIPASLLLDIPLVLGALKHTVLGNVNHELMCTSRFTLFEVVDGLAWEFSFRGGTQQCSLGG
jgi:hypothetical protein